ncbi:MAG TPA: hypothetical protein VGW12_21295 [Pyrinomonadaceae bacterium]|nr:hypothetical protein [Pyrinomonadaceae bacterium]
MILSRVDFLVGVESGANSPSAYGVILAAVVANKFVTRAEDDGDFVRGENQHGRTIKMPRGDKSAYTDKQKRQAEHIEEGYEKRGVSEEEAERRAWATVNKSSGGGKKSGSGRGKSENKAPAKKGGKKGGSKKGGSKKGSAKKGGSKKGGTKKGGAKKGGSKKG